MYSPKTFEVDDIQTINQFLNQFSFGQLISQSDDSLVSTHLPFLVDAENRTAMCHMAKANPQWESLSTQTVLISIEGAHGYISPNWYESGGVPTWNYQALHAEATCEVIQDPEALSEMVLAMSDHYEARSPKLSFNEPMLNAIVGVKFEIQSLTCKFKLSQNRPKEDQINIIRRLYETDQVQLAKAMEAHLRLDEQHAEF